MPLPADRVVAAKPCMGAGFPLLAKDLGDDMELPEGWTQIVAPARCQPGETVRFQLGGRRLLAKVPPNVDAGQEFGVQVVGYSVSQPQIVAVPPCAAAGQTVELPGFDGSKRLARVPSFLEPGQEMVAMVPVPQDEVQTPMGPPLGALELRPWLAAAAGFVMNTDFEVGPAAHVKQEGFDLKPLMDEMKQASRGKQTIQLLGDKIQMSRLLDNLRVPQVPALVCLQGQEDVSGAVSSLVDEHLLKPDACDTVLKPTHLSNGEGILTVPPVAPGERESTIRQLEGHIRRYLVRTASEHESQALQSVRPGFVCQAMYKSAINFQVPLEMRVTALWGHARVGVWWWGEQTPHRNTWIVRDPGEGRDLERDEWRLVHEHEAGSNPGFDNALVMFRAHISQMAATCEKIARAVGAPFLRADFFVGSDELGVRLNEVAYGSGVDYRRMAGGRIVDDSAAIAQILQVGLSLCSQRFPPSEFLECLGVVGSDYASTVVEPVSSIPEAPARPRLEDILARQLALPEEMCCSPNRVRRIPGQREECKERLCEPRPCPVSCSFFDTLPSWPAVLWLASW